MTETIQGNGGSGIKFWIGELYDSEDEKAENELEERGLRREEIEAIKNGQTYNLQGEIE